jgi:DNA-binding beta-propeller fold protein YncE
MRRFCLTFALGTAALTFVGTSVVSAQDGPYKVLKAAKVGGDGRFDYVYADEAGRKLYIARRAPDRMTVFNLDTLEPAGEFANISAAGAAVSAKSNHGFASSKPVVMWDTKTLAAVKTIEVEGNPDGIMHDPFNDRVYVFSHRAPNATVINAADGAVLGTIDLGGAPEQAASDGKGHVYVDIEDKGNIAVIDAKTMAVTAHYDLEGKGGQCAGLALDAKNQILFATCRAPQVMVILSATDGKIITTLPIGQGTDGAVFNPKTMEAFSSQGDGTLTIVKENSPSSFVVEQNLPTMRGAKTLTLDAKTGKVLLIAAETAAPTTPPPAPPGAPAEGRGRGRGTMVPGSFTILVVGK